MAWPKIRMPLPRKGKSSEGPLHVPSTARTRRGAFTTNTMPRCPSSARCPRQLGTGRGTLNGGRPLAAQQPLPSEPPAGSTSGAVLRQRTEPE